MATIKSTIELVDKMSSQLSAIEGNINSRDGRDVLVELKTVCDRLKVVGTYYDFKEK